MAILIKPSKLTKKILKNVVPYGRIFKTFDHSLLSQSQIEKSIDTFLPLLLQKDIRFQKKFIAQTLGPHPHLILKNIVANHILFRGFEKVGSVHPILMKHIYRNIYHTIFEKKYKLYVYKCVYDWNPIWQKYIYDKYLKKYYNNTDYCYIIYDKYLKKYNNNTDYKDFLSSRMSKEYLESHLSRQCTKKQCEEQVHETIKYYLP